MRERTVRVVAGILAGAVAAAFGAGGHAQSGAAPNPAASKEWPTYGHDPGGMRFSPLTQLTPANVDQLQVAWVYHMKPAAPSADGRAGAPAAAGVNAPVGDTPPPAAQGRGRGRGGSGFASSEVTPLVINGTMYLATPYSRVVAVDADHGQGNRGRSSFPPGTRRHAVSNTGPATRRRRRRSSSARATASCTRWTRRPGSRTRPSATRARQSEYSGDPAGPAGPRRPELAAHRLQEPRDHRRDDAGESAERAGRRRARVGHAHRQAGMDVPLDSARRREIQRHLGRRQLEEPFGRERLGLPHRGRPARHRLHALRRALGRPVRRRPRRATTCSATASWRPTRTRASISGISRSCITTSGTRIWRDAPALIDVKQGGKTIPAVAASARSACCSCSIASPASRFTAWRSGRCRRAKCRWNARRRRSRSRSSRAPLSRMTMRRGGHRDRHAGAGSGLQEADRGRATGRAVPAGLVTTACACSFPATMAGSTGAARRSIRNSGICSSTRTSWDSCPGCAIAIRTRPARRGRRAGQSRRSERSVSRASRAAALQQQGSDPQQLPCQQPPWGQLDGGQCQHRRVRMARAARRHGQSAAGEAEDRTSRQRRHDCHRRRPGLRGRDRRQPLPRVRREDRQGVVDLQAPAAPPKRRR